MIRNCCKNMIGQDSLAGQYVAVMTRMPGRFDIMLSECGGSGCSDMDMGST